MKKKPDGMKNDLEGHKKPPAHLEVSSGKSAGDGGSVFPEEAEKEAHLQRRPASKVREGG